MEKEQPLLTKTCSICGELKPLAAFLQMSGARGAEYGAVCSDCRKKGADKPRVPESDETTQSSSGVVIDSKNKLQADIEKREQHEQIEEEYYEEREENQLEQLQDDSKLEQKTQQEKQHRQTFLDRSTLSNPKTISSESRWRADQTIERANTETAINLEKNIQEESREKGIDQTAVEDLRSGLKEKHKGVGFQQGDAFKSFSALLGKSSTFSSSNTPTEKQNTTIAVEIENKWGPGSRKK